MAALATLTLTQICDAIRTTLGASSEIARAQSVSELSDSMEDLPMLRVYPFSTTTDPSGTTDRSSFGGKGGVENTPVRRTSLTVNVDVPVDQRTDIGDNLARVAPTWDSVEVIFTAQNVKPYFGLAGVKAFSWTAQLTEFQWNELQLPDIGVQFKVNIEVF